MKAREIFERTISLIGERDADGNIAEDTGDFRHNAVELINTLLGMVWPSECMIRNIPAESYRYAVPALSSLEDEVPLHLALCHSVLPFGLAYLFLLDEDPIRAKAFYQLFYETESKLVYRFIKAQRQTITDVYQ